MSRISGALSALAITTYLLIQPVLAQDQPTAPAPAPAVHAGTKLAFPASVGGATLLRGEAVGPASVGYQYATPQGMQISAFVLESGGNRRVPPGAESPQVMAQFGDDVDQTAAQAKLNGYSRFERPAVASICTYGTTSFRCLVYSASGGSGRVYSKLLMTGYNGYFLKIRIDWSQASKHTQVEADQALQAFVTALLH
jgi:hypothetical protein